MDGIHDLGGKQGYGPIDINETNQPFQQDWEKRQWGLSQCVTANGITIDWWRHCRELIMPEDYLARPYMDSWSQTDLATFIDAGIITLQEAISGQAESTEANRGKLPNALSLEQAIEQDRQCATRFDAEIEVLPKFAIGQEIITLQDGTETHTRLPQYARGRAGIIHAHHGAHIFPDLSSQGIEIHQHLYTVVFPSAELWPENKDQRNCVFLDLWESYLIPK